MLLDLWKAVRKIMKIQTYNQNFDISQALNDYLQERFDILDKYNLDIIDCQVKFIRDQHHQKGDVYTVEAKVSLPNQEPIFVKEQAEDPHAAVDIVQDKLSRLLVKTKNKKVDKLRKSIKTFKKLKFWRKKDY